MCTFLEAVLPAAKVLPKCCHWQRAEVAKVLPKCCQFPYPPPLGGGRNWPHGRTANGGTRFFRSNWGDNESGFGSTFWGMAA